MYVSIQCFGIEIETNNGYPLLNFIYFTSELKKKKKKKKLVPTTKFTNSSRCFLILIH